MCNDLCAVAIGILVHDFRITDTTSYLHHGASILMNHNYIIIVQCVFLFHSRSRSLVISIFFFFVFSSFCQDHHDEYNRSYLFELLILNLSYQRLNKQTNERQRRRRRRRRQEIL